MPGGAFPIEEALVACRWAEQVVPRGYRVVIRPGRDDAEEVIEVHVPGARAPAFSVHRTPHAVLVTDCIGLTMSFPTIADALLTMAPLPKSGKREVLKGPSPAWLPVIAAHPAGTGTVWHRVVRAVMGVAASLVRPG